MQKVLLMIAGLLTAINTASVSSVEILVPPAYISIDQDHLYIIGKSNADRVVIYINNLFHRDETVKDSIFHLFVNFGYGLNEIKLEPVYDSFEFNKEDAAYLEILCSPHSTGRIETLYPTYHFHTAQSEWACAGCHKYSEGYLAFDDSLSSCIECHVDFSQKALLHANLTNEHCKTCHRAPAVSNDPALSITDLDNPCYDCHKDKISKFNKDYIHGPVAGGSCSVCHDPHGSPHEFSLINDQEVLCFSCHEFYREFKYLPLQHQPFEDGRCGSCHDPHATNHRWTLIRSSEKLCLKCHSPEDKNMKFHSHPYDVKPKDQKSISLRLSPSGKLECLSCHDPHASRAEHLLRGDQENTCLGCHRDKQ